MGTLGSGSQIPSAHGSIQPYKMQSCHSPWKSGGADPIGLMRGWPLAGREGGGPVPVAQGSLSSSLEGQARAQVAGCHLGSP